MLSKLNDNKSHFVVLVDKLNNEIAKNHRYLQTTITPRSTLHFHEIKILKQTKTQADRRSITQKIFCRYSQRKSTMDVFGSFAFLIYSVVSLSDFKKSLFARSNLQSSARSIFHALSDNTTFVLYSFNFWQS